MKKRNWIGGMAIPKFRNLDLVKSRVRIEYMDSNLISPDSLGAIDAPDYMPGGSCMPIYEDDLICNFAVQSTVRREA